MLIDIIRMRHFGGISIIMPGFHIEDYRFGKITIDGIQYTRDLIILPSRIVAGWWRSEGHLLQIEDLQDVFDSKPQLLIIGQGAYSRMRLAAEVEHALEAAGIAWMALATDEACREYNRRSSNQEVAAALHLTC